MGLPAVFHVGILFLVIILEIFCPTTSSLKTREFLVATGSSFEGDTSFVSNICAAEGLVEGDIDADGMEAIEGETDAEGPLPATEGETDGETELPTPEGDIEDEILGETDGETLPPNDGLIEGDTELPPPTDGEIEGDTEAEGLTEGDIDGDIEAEGL